MKNIPSLAVHSNIQGVSPILNRANLKDQITDLLRDAIVKGRLPSGSSKRSYGASSPVSQAMSQRPSGRIR